MRLSMGGWVAKRLRRLPKGLAIIMEETASVLGCRFLAVEIVCSDAAEHRRRARQRVGDIEGLKLPDWQEIEHRDYAPWPEADLRLDTARLTVAEAAQAIVNDAIRGRGQ